MKKKEYISKEGKYFIHFLPPPTFDKLSSDERKFYKQYRDNHRWMFQGEQKIQELKLEIEKLKKQIKLKQVQINGTPEKDGWKSKMLEGYTRIGHLSKISKDYEFYCSISLRDKRKSRTREKQEKGMILNRNLYNTNDIWTDKTKDGRDRNNPSEDFSTFREKIGKGEIREEIKGKIYERCIINIESKDKQFRKKLYVGVEDNYFQVLKTYDDSINWESKDDKVIKENLRDIYKGFVRFQIYKRGIQGFYYYSGKSNKDTPYNYQEVISWIKKMGNDIFEWMDK